MRARKYNSEILEKIFADIPKSLQKQVSSTMVIAALIGDEMKRKNLTVTDVAKLFKVKLETINNWLSGDFDFKISLLCKIEEKIGIELFKITKYVKDQNVVIGDKALTPAGDGHVVIGEKALVDNKEVMSSINFTKKIIKRYIEMGCVPRMNGSLISLIVSDNLTCDCCGKKVPTLAGFENKHPHCPDIGLCANCVEEYYKIINSHEQSTNETNGIY